MDSSNVSEYNFSNWSAVSVAPPPAPNCDVGAFELGRLNPQEIIACGLDPDRYVTDAWSPYRIIMFIFEQLQYFAYFLCLIGFVVGIINLVTSSGDKNKITTGLNILKNSVIAFVIVILVLNIRIIVINLFGFTLPDGF